jgi:tetratricopeptide (TPR) repeat protein
MAKTQHRIRKHDMKEDSFVTFAFRAQEFIQANQRFFIAGLVVVVVLVLGVWFLKSSGDRAAIESEQALSQAFSRVQQNDMVGAAAAYQNVIDDFGGTAGAREAVFYLANLHFVEQEWPQAIENYQRYTRDYSGYDPGRTVAAHAAIGDAFQALDDHQRALESYDKALTIEEGAYLEAEICIAAARSALASEQPDLAIAYADRLFEKQGNSLAMVQMREMLAQHGMRYLRGF